MLSRPFRGQPRVRLVMMLIFLLVLEGAAGAGLYRNNRPAAAATQPQQSTTATHQPATLATLAVAPALLLAGHKATFSTSVREVPNHTVTYVVRYSDGSKQTGPARTDVAGFSSHTFKLKYVPKNQKESITVSVTANGRTVAETTFGVFLPASR